MWADVDGQPPRSNKVVNAQWKGLENYNFIRVWEDYVYKDGGLQYKMKYSLANMKKEMHTTCLQLANTAIAAFHHFLDLLH